MLRRQGRSSSVRQGSWSQSAWQGGILEGEVLKAKGERESPKAGQKSQHALQMSKFEGARRLWRFRGVRRASDRAPGADLNGTE